MGHPGTRDLTSRLATATFPERAPIGERLTLALFATALFSSAFLLFALAIVAIIFAPAILHEARSRAPANPAAAPLSNVAPEKSIAVLPFENLSDDKQNSFFADGVQDDILTELSHVADLKVVSRTSVSQYKAAPRNLRLQHTNAPGQTSNDA